MPCNPHTTRLAALTLATIAPAALATDYAWNSAATSTWSTTASWTPASPVGGPTSADNIITPTAFGQLQFVVAAPSVTNWSYNSGSSWTVISNGVASVLTISNTLSKAGAGTLQLRPGGSQPLTINAGNLDVSGGILDFPYQAPGLELTVSGTTTIGGTNARLQMATKDTFVGALGAVSFTGTGGTILLNSSTDLPSRTVAATSLSGSDTTSVIASGNTSGTARLSTVRITGATGSTAYAGKLLNNAGSNSASSLTLEKTGASTQILTGILNTYSGGTSITGGTLLLDNASASGTGIGAITVGASGTIGGTGRVAPTLANTVIVSGTVSPGTIATPIESFEIAMSGSTGGVTIQSGATFALDLGAAGLSINTPGTSDALIYADDVTGQFAFNGNALDFKATGEEGWYKIFDAQVAAGSPWTGVGGLSVTNLAPGLSGTLHVGDGTNGALNDIYLEVVPEPASLALLAGAGLFLGSRRRRA